MYKIFGYHIHRLGRGVLNVSCTVGIRRVQNFWLPHIHRLGRRVCVECVAYKTGTHIIDQVCAPARAWIPPLIVTPMYHLAHSSQRIRDISILASVSAGTKGNILRQAHGVGIKHEAPRLLRLIAHANKIGLGDLQVCWKLSGGDTITS